MSYPGPDRRRSHRIVGKFIVSYRLLEEEDCLDLSQTKNISTGGMLLTTNRKFNPNTKLSIEIRLPFDENPIHIIGKVVESHEITRDLIYDTRLEFLSITDKSKKAVLNTVEYFIKKGN